jgi:hypothetical protein
MTGPARPRPAHQGKVLAATASRTAVPRTGRTGRPPPALAPRTRIMKMDLASGQPPAWVHSGRIYRGCCAAVPRLAVSPSANGLLALRHPVRGG